MATLAYLVGIVGSIVLVIGAAWPEKKNEQPVRSVKDWLLSLGGILMLIYSIINYTIGGSIFFIFLQILIAISSILMMLDTDDRLDLVILSICATILIGWSLTLFTGYETIIFIFGLTGVGLGYAFKPSTIRREISLTLGSIIIVIFSYLQSNWIFCGLNIFFAFFSGYYLIKIIQSTSQTPHAKLRSHP